MSSILDGITSPSDVWAMPFEDLGQLATELRQEMIDSCALNGGHLAPSLGAVEIVIAAYRALDIERDRLLFDVGHQAYAHKLLTGRREGFAHLRKTSGVSGFTRRAESPYDVHDAGHASDALPTAVGLALARDLDGGNENIVSVVGDASIAGGLSYEALNYAGQQQFKRFVVIMNDNEMSISHSVGAFAAYLANLRTSGKYNMVRDSVESGLSRSGNVGDALVRWGERAKEATKQFILPDLLFEDFGFTYLGPIDGHDIRALQHTLTRALAMDKPVIIHAVTKKGFGYLPAENNPELFHGVGPFDQDTGEVISKPPKRPSFTDIFSRCLIQEAAHNENIVAITAAMPAGTGLKEFGRRYPERMFDVGIAEECAVTMASGLAIAGKVPVVAIYSTFLQRSYDEISTNVCLQNLHVVFAVDRAGLVGEDGSTHHGAFDLAYLRSLPNMRIVAPSDETELAGALKAALECDGPVAVRFPRGSVPGNSLPDSWEPLPLTSVVRWESGAGPVRVTVLAVGRMVTTALEVAHMLYDRGVDCRIIDMRWVKPIDLDAVREACASSLVVTVEDGTLSGGFGSAVLEAVADIGCTATVLRLGLPDAYVGHGSVDELFSCVGLDAQGIASSVLRWLNSSGGVCNG